MYSLCFYVPEQYVQPVKQAIFDAGAGRIGNYDACCWQVLGQGQFRPMKGSQPFIGTLDSVEQVAEYRVECVCDAQHIEAVVAALKQAHPYEEPAYNVVKLENI